jgi:hypothetical protein
VVVADRFRREWYVVILIALSTLAVINPLNPQDVSRLGLSRSLVERGSLNIDPYALNTSDRARRSGHWYSDKAPGISLLAVPSVEALRVVDHLAGNAHGLAIWSRLGHIWLLRILTGGVGLLAAALLIGRAAEGLRPGYGAPVAITYALGTIAGPLGATTFGHDVAAAVSFAAFVVAARGRRLAVAAGALAGVAVLFEYQAALIVLVLAVYVAVSFGRHALLRFCLGGVPAALALGAYNWGAFGSPLNLSYTYVSNQFTERQHQGLFGIGSPTAHGAWLLFLDGRGLLIVSPVLLAAAGGLVLLWRRGFRAEAGVCLTITLLFLFANMGYFEPYGGISPGPRFFASALPFLSLGLVEAYKRQPVVTAILALWSITFTTLDGLSWGTVNKLVLDSAANTYWTPNTVWARLRVLDTYDSVYLVYAAVALTVAYGAFELAHARASASAGSSS